MYDGPNRNHCFFFLLLVQNDYVNYPVGNCSYFNEVKSLILVECVVLG